jgi:hypothetical protein
MIGARESSGVAADHSRPPRDPVEYDDFIASAEVYALAHLLEEERWPDIANIITTIGRHYGYRRTAEVFRPALEALRHRRRVRAYD